MVERRKTGWVCVCRFGGIGDNLIATSILPQLAEKYKVEVMTQDPQHVVFENNPYITKLSVKGKEDLPQNDALAWQNYFRARSHEYDMLINLSHSCESTLALLPGQTMFWWPTEWRRKYCGRNYLEMIHDVAGLPYNCNPRFFPTDEEREKALATKAKVGKEVIGWCLAGTRLDKVYPYSTMAIARIIRELGLPVIMFGGMQREFEIAKQIQEHVKRQNGTDAGLHLALSPDAETSAGWTANAPGEAVTLKPKEEPLWPIRRVLSQVQTCDLVIGPDTGTMWAVAMEDMPKIMLLSHASPENITKHWRKTTTLHADAVNVPCWPCHQLHDEPSTCTPNAEGSGAACITDIKVETILETARKLLHVRQPRLTQ